jgi:predicted AlkP superfamily phosphohydrolase/phosphomutase
LRAEVEEVVGEYLFDCTNFRTLDRDDLLKQVYAMTDRRFALADHLLSTRPWDMFAMVEMGTDRMHHAFWKDMDPAHRKHDPNGKYRDAIRSYYHHVDAHIGRLLEHADDDTYVFVVSDHGAKRMDGGIRVNEWLRREGYLTTLAEPSGRPPGRKGATTAACSSTFAAGSLRGLSSRRITRPSAQSSKSGSPRSRTRTATRSARPCSGRKISIRR